jgi:transposase
MGRRGRKRRLDLEDEYWQLILAGVGTVDACRRVGITRKTGFRWRKERGGIAPVRLLDDERSGRYLARLAEFPELSAAALYEGIRAMGYAGGLSILKEFALPCRRRRREPVVRFETPPGRQAQVDRAELGLHTLEEERRRLHLFVMVLGFSRTLYAEAVTAADSQTFLACHARAFAYFGGMPEEILYDNAKVVVLARTAAGLRFQPALLDFAGRNGFAPRLCRPYHAQTKGKVERSIGYLKDRFCVRRSVSGLEDLNAQLLAWPDGVANRREHATTGERPLDRLPREGLTPFALAPPWRPPQPPPAPRRPLVRFAAPAVEARPLAAYEEAAR